LEEQQQGLIAAFERNRPLDSSSSSIDEEEEEETTVKVFGFSCSGKKYDIVHNRSSSSFHGEGNNGEVFFQEAQKNENYTYEECGGSRDVHAVGVVSTEPAAVVTVAELAPSTSHQEQQQD
jgi:hypothetical protein